MLGRYSFLVPEAVAKGELRTLRDPTRESLTRFSVPLHLKPKFDPPGLLSASAGAETLAVGRRCRAFAPMLGKWMPVMMVDQFGKSFCIGLIPDVQGCEPIKLASGRSWGTATIPSK